MIYRLPVKTPYGIRKSSNKLAVFNVEQIKKLISEISLLKDSFDVKLSEFNECLDKIYVLKNTLDEKIISIGNHLNNVDEIYSIIKEKITEISEKNNELKIIKKGDKGESASPEEIATILLSNNQFLELIKGKDGSNADEKKIIEEVVKRVLETINIPLDGIDADENKIIKAVIKELPKHIPKFDVDTITETVIDKIVKDKKLKKEHISGLDNEINSYRNQLAGKHYGKDTWARGGGDTIEAGNGIVVTRANGKATITSTAGGFQNKTELSAETPDGVITDFTFTNNVGTIFYNGVKQIENVDYTKLTAKSIRFSSLSPVGYVENLY